MSGSDVERICERVRVDLPRLADETLPGWRRRLAVRHLEGCEACAAELERQRSVTEGLHGLGESASTSGPPPPEDLLEQILADVEDPGVRARVARPVRGAVSGARPEFSVTAVALVALLIYLVWRVVRRFTAGTPLDRVAYRTQPEAEQEAWDEAATWSEHETR